jgi:hypothetical protein
MDAAEQGHVEEQPAEQPMEGGEQEGGEWILLRNY